MVHIFSSRGYNIAIDVNSGSIHIVDSITADILKRFNIKPNIKQVVEVFGDQYPITDIEESIKEIDYLYNQGELYSQEYDEEKLLSRIDSNSAIKALCLHIAHDCNLKCEYCFASKGDYKLKRSLMTQEVAFKSVDFLIENSGNRENIEIDFFGGEPMLNFDVVKRTVEYARSREANTGKKFFFTITTNGMLLNEENIKYINEHFGNIVISIDGRKEVHDAKRYDKSGRGTYDRIVPSAQSLVEKRGDKQYFIRGTYTADNLDFSKDAAHLADLGFKEISVEPVVGSNEDFSIKEEHIDQIFNEYERIIDDLINRMKNKKPYKFYHFNIDLYKGPCIYKRVTACGAGYEYVAISPEGDIYPCHQFVGEDGFNIGSVYSGIQNHCLVNSFKNNTIFAKKECRDCWAKFYCSGGCHANAYFTNNTISKPNDLSCILQKKRIECAVMIEVLKQLEGLS